MAGWGSRSAGGGPCLILAANQGGLQETWTSALTRELSLNGCAPRTPICAISKLTRYGGTE